MTDLPAEIDERIQAILPAGWGASSAQAVPTNVAGERYNTWRVVFQLVTFDEGDQEAMRTIELDVLGRTLEDLLTVARRLEAIGAALTFPWSVSIEAQVDGIRTHDNDSGVDEVGE